MKIRSISAIIAAGLLALAVSSCKYENEENLFGGSTGNCDTTNVTYSGDISKIVSNKCISCHGASFATDGSGIRLDNYNDLKKNIDLVQPAVNHNPDYSAMPKNSMKLDDCSLKKIDIWVAAGMPNN